VQLDVAGEAATAGSVTTANAEQLSNDFTRACAAAADDDDNHCLTVSTCTIYIYMSQRKLWVWKMQEWKMTDKNYGQTFSKLLAKLRGLANAGLENDGQTFSTL